MIKKHGKKALSLLLVLVMSLSLITTSGFGFAAGEDESEDTENVVVETADAEETSEEEKSLSEQAEEDTEPAESDEQTDAEADAEAVSVVIPDADTAEDADLPEADAEEILPEEDEEEVLPEETEPESAEPEEQADEPEDAEDEEDEEVPAEESALPDEEENTLIEQTVKAVVYTGATYDSRLLNSADITLKGEMPEDASAKAYPVSADIDGENVLTAYDVTIYDADGNEFQPEDDTIQVTVDHSAIQKAISVDADIEVYELEDADADAEEIVNAKTTDNGVIFDADSDFSVFAVATEDTMATWSAQSDGVRVTATALKSALPENAELSVELYNEDDKEYEAAGDALNLDEDTGMAAMDISFKVNGKEVEPSSPVYLSVNFAAILPEDADTDTLEVQHLEENGNGVIPVAVAQAGEGINTITGVAKFTVESFSTFTVTWSSGDSGGPNQGQESYSFTLTVNTYDEEDNHLMDTNVDGVNMSRSSGEEFDFTAITVDGYTFDYADVVYGGTTYQNATKLTVTIGNTADTRYTVSIDYEGGTYTNSGSTSNVTANVYFTPNPSVIISATDNGEQGYLLTAEALHFGGDPELIWEETLSSDGIADIAEAGDGVTVKWATDNGGNVIAQVGDTVTVKVTAMYTAADGTTQRATDTCVLTYGAVTVTIRVSYTATGGTPGGGGGGQSPTTYYPEGADVTLLDSGGFILATGTTDANGYITFDLIPGEYEVEAIYTSSSAAYMGDTTIEVTADGENSFTLTMTNAGSSVDHIDIGILATATLYVNGRELTQDISINEFDFESENMIFQYSYSEDGSTGYYDAKGFMDLSSTEESTGTDSSGNTVNQIRIDGTYPVGTYPDEIVYYYLSLTKDVTFTDDETGQTYTVTMTFTSNFYYWDPANECPPLQNNTTWENGGVVTGSGMDFVMTVASSDALVNVEKFVVDSDGNLMDAAGEQFTFELYLDHNEDGTDPYDEVEEYDEFTMTTSGDGLGYYQGFVEVGHYYVVETDWPEQINGKNYLYTVVNIAYVGVEEEERGERQTGSSIVSDEAIADAERTPVFIFNNVYGEEEPEKTVDVGDGTEISVGDELEYTISYHNNTGKKADIVITDELDAGVDYVSSDPQGEYDETTRTVTWSIKNVDADRDGYVTLTVKVNKDAQGKAEVDNTASVQIGNNAAVNTNTVENPIGPDEPTPPTKSENIEIKSEVAVGDRITYIITYYNNNNTPADVIITDELDAGMDYVSSTNGGVYDEASHTVTWTIKNVPAFTSGSVELVVEVNENAKVNAEVENTASVQIGNNKAVDTNTLVNPLEPDDPVPPEKSVNVDEESTTAVGDEVVYTITYYNNNNVPAEVIITDKLDEGVDYVSSTDGGVYDETNHTVSWTLEDVSAFTEGSVKLTVVVNENAVRYDEITNTASVQIGNEEAVDTNPVDVPLTPTYREYFPIDEEIVPDEDDRDTWVKNESVNEYNAIEIEMSTYLPVIDPYDLANGTFTMNFHDVLDSELNLDEADADFSVYIGGVKVDHQYYTVTTDPVDGCYFHVNVNLTALYTDGVITDDDLLGNTEIMIFFYADLEGLDLNGSYKSTVWYDVYDGENWEYTSNVAVVEVYTYEISVLKYDATALVDDDYESVTLAGATLGLYYDETGKDPVIRNGEPYTVISGEDGIAMFYGLAAGTYYIIEIGAPYGYKLSDQAVEVTINADNVIDNIYETRFANEQIPADEPREPEKTANVETGSGVAVEDEITYTITYYNNNNVEADVVITDPLDAGVDFVSATDGGVYDADTHTVTWTIQNVAAFTEGSVELTVVVNENAEKIEDIENTAGVQIGNEASVDTNTVDIPIEPDEPTVPKKSADVDTGAKVAVGDEFTYTISYYNNYAEPTTIVITDVLDAGVDFVTATDGGVYDADSHTVIWTIENAPALTSGSVDLTVTVNGDALRADGVSNTAAVQIGNDASVDTNTVYIPLEETESSIPDNGNPDSGTPNSGNNGGNNGNNGGTTGGNGGNNGNGGTSNPLPQTGQLNWPIWLFGGLGIIVLAVGIIMMLTGKKGKREA